MSECLIDPNVKRNSQGFALKKLGKGWCIKVALILRQRLGRMIRPGHRAGLTCGDTRCEAEPHVFEERMLGTADVTKFADSTEGQRRGREVPEVMPGWDLESWANEILNVPRQKPAHGYRTRQARREYYSVRELAQKSRREIPCGDALKNAYLDENGVTVLMPSYREDDWD